MIYIYKYFANILGGVLKNCLMGFLKILGVVMQKCREMISKKYWEMFCKTTAKFSAKMLEGALKNC